MARSCSALFTISLHLIALPTAALAEGVARDEQGRVVESIDEDGVTSYRIYDDLGALVETRKSDGVLLAHDAGAESAEAEEE